MDSDPTHDNRRRVRVKLRSREKVRLASSRPTRRSLWKVVGQVLLGIVALVAFVWFTFRVLDSVSVPPKQTGRK